MVICFLFDFLLIIRQVQSGYPLAKIKQKGVAMAMQIDFTKYQKMSPRQKFNELFKRKKTSKPLMKKSSLKKAL